MISHEFTLQHCSLSEEDDSFSTACSEPYSQELKLLKAHQQVLDGKYKLLSKLGAGSSGSVFKARNLQTSSNVAIKYLSGRFDPSKQSAVLKKLTRELQILKHLSSCPRGSCHVTKLLDVMFTQNIGYLISHSSNNFNQNKESWAVFIVMEHTEGSCSLLDFLNRAQLEGLPLSEEEASLISYNIISALAYVHSCNVIHRDIKPSNILVLPDLTVKLCDFGLARTMQDQSVLPSVFPASPDARTRHSAFQKTTKASLKKKPRSLSPHVVSRSYRPPEVIVLEKEYNTAVDIWSLGCVLAELIQCTEPYSSGELQPDQLRLRQLFRSESCQALSPQMTVNGGLDYKESIYNQGDSLNVMLSVLGFQGSTDTSFITSNAALERVTNGQKLTPKINFLEEFCHTSQDLAWQIQGCLEFNPLYRPRAKQLLEMPVYDPYRNTLKEQTEGRPLQLAIDRLGATDLENRAVQLEIRQALAIQNTINSG